MELRCKYVAPLPNSFSNLIMMLLCWSFVGNAKNEPVWVESFKVKMEFSRYFIGACLSFFIINETDVKGFFEQSQDLVMH